MTLFAHKEMNLHLHFHGEGGEWGEGPTSENDCPDSLTDQLMHAVPGAETPVAQDLSCIR